MPEGNLVARKVFERYLRGRWHRGKLGAVTWLLRTFGFEPVRSHHGPILCGNPNDFTSALAISGAYGRLLSDHINRLQPNVTFVDIGASYGLFTVLASQRLTQGHVLAFEPNPDVYKRLVEALRLNHCHNVTAARSAVGRASDSMKLQYCKAHSGRARLVENPSPSSGDFFDVSVINPAESDLFDEARTRNALHVKIDVEGYELEIIRILKQAPWYQSIRSLVVEIDDGYLRAYGSEAQELYKTLQDDGFRPQIGRLDAGQHYDEVFLR